MRKLLLASAIASLAGVAVVAVAAPEEQASTEAKAYIHYSFGGSKSSQPDASNLHYGLRMDYHSPYLTAARPPLMQMDFDRHGLTETRVNGLSVVQRLALNQTEGEAAPDAAPAEEAPAEESSSGDEGGSSGTETSYSVIDWTLIGIGVVGIGFVVAETLDTDESPNPPEEDDDEGGGLLGGLLGILLTDQSGYAGKTVDVERQQWLDGGTGQMGDLGG